MPDYGFDVSLVTDQIGGVIRTARNARITVTNYSTGLTAANLKQSGQPVPWVTSDGKGRAVFTSTEGQVIITAPNGLARLITSPDFIQASITASASAATAASAASSSAALAQASADIVTGATGVAVTGKNLINTAASKTFGPGTGWTAASTATAPDGSATYVNYTAVKPIPATAGSTYTAQGTISNVITFNASGARVTFNQPAAGVPYTFTIPAGAVSFAITYQTAAASGVQVESGSTPTTVAPYYVQVTNLASSDGTPYLTGTEPVAKLAPLNLSLAGSVSTITAASQHVRIPFKLPAQIKRARLHVRNYNDLYGLTYTGVVTFTSVYVGKHLLTNGDLTGEFSATPTQVVTTAATPTDGSEYVSGWFAIPGNTGDDMLLSYGFTTDGAMTIHRGIGGCWTSTANTEAGQTTPTTAMTQGYQPPLDVWLECEINGRVPVIMYLGDSLTAGYGATFPIYDSWASKHALANGAWPWNNGHTGSRIYQWSSNLTYWRYAKHAAMAAPNAAVVAGGSNDLSLDSTTLQADLATVVGNIRSLGTTRIHLATIMPRGFTGTRETARLSHNTWLRQLPLGAVNTWEFSEAVESAPGATTLDARWNFDGTHLNRGGYARLAATVSSSLAG